MTTSHHYPGILFVCTANRCRSVLAEAIFKKALSNLGPPWAHWQIESAGTWAIPNQPPLQGTLYAASQMELDITDHRSRRVNKRMIQDFELVLVMESSHKEALQIEFPESAKKIHLLSEMVDGDFPILDPVGGSETEFLNTGFEIAECLNKGLLKIVELAQRK